MKLYDIPLEFTLIEQALIDNDGELTPELEKSLDDLLRSGKDKIEAAAMILRGLEMEAEACIAESKRLDARVVSLGKNAERLKKLMLYALDGAFGGKIKTPLFTIWGQTSAPTIRVDLAPWTDLVGLPDQFVRTKRELAKDAIKAAFKIGQRIPDEVIITEIPGTRFLQVR